MVTGVPGERARSALARGAAATFADVRWVAETGSTNADALALLRAGEPEGIVLVADHQTAGRGRAGRRWTAPPEAGLLLTVLLRPPAAAVDLCTTAVALAATDALEQVAGVDARLKWPNDLVFPGDGSVADRKLAGILAEADWPAGGGDPGVAVGIGINVAWPDELPDDLAEVAVACNHVSDRSVDREELLVALVEALATRYARLLVGDRASLVAEWRERSATLGQRVRVEQTHGEVEGTAVDITGEGHLVVELDDGSQRSFAVGDVVHVRPTG